MVAIGLVGMAAGVAACGLGELAVGFGVAEAAAVVSALGVLLAAEVLLPAGLVVPVPLPQAVVRMSSAANMPMPPTWPRLAFCFPVRAGFCVPELGAVGLVTVG